MDQEDSVPALDYQHSMYQIQVTEDNPNDPLDGGRNSAFERAIIRAYEKAFTELGVAEDENAAVSLVLRIVQ
ncbi:MAG: hypothetical protein KAV69_01580 [Deltaproteobacteria bacterium]|nr:hypothetical protein [Deltaproteobacteria bacterium]